MKNLTITVSGPPCSGKTTAALLIKKVLMMEGAVVTEDNVCPYHRDKLLEYSRDTMAGRGVTIREVNTRG